MECDHSKTAYEIKSVTKLNIEKYFSPLSSAKKFQETLRIYDNVNTGIQHQKSPMKKKLSFGKSDQKDLCSQIKNKFFVDITKKIKKVQNPFQRVYKQVQIEKVQKFQDINEIIFENWKKFNQIEQVKEECKNLSQEQDSFFEKNSVNEQKNEQKVQNYSSSDHHQLNSSSQNYFKEKKAKKKLIKKHKKKIARQIKAKIIELSPYINLLNSKQTQESRQELIEQLSKQLCEQKYDRLINELKKLI